MSLTRCVKELMNNIISGHIITKKLNRGKAIETSSLGFLFRFGHAYQAACGIEPVPSAVEA